MAGSTTAWSKPLAAAQRSWRGRAGAVGGVHRDALCHAQDCPRAGTLIGQTFLPKQTRLDAHCTSTRCRGSSTPDGRTVGGARLDMGQPEVEAHGLRQQRQQRALLQLVVQDRRVARAPAAQRTHWAGRCGASLHGESTAYASKHLACRPQLPNRRVRCPAIPALKLAKLSMLAKVSQLDTRLNQLRAHANSERGRCKQSSRSCTGRKLRKEAAGTARHAARTLSGAHAPSCTGVLGLQAARSSPDRCSGANRVRVGLCRASPGPDGQARGRVAERDHQRQLRRRLHHARNAQPPGQQLRATRARVGPGAAAGCDRLTCGAPLARAARMSSPRRPHTLTALTRGMREQAGA